jgi:hypothetical protein
MRSHLEKGCQRCESALHWVDEVAATVSALPALETPPPDLVQQAKALFPFAQSSEHWTGDLEALVTGLAGY